jgi:hypothetical protein
MTSGSVSTVVYPDAKVLIFFSFLLAVMTFGETLKGLGQDSAASV